MCFRLGEITLRDFKTMLDRSGEYRYHFKALDPEFGTVKEEVSGGLIIFILSFYSVIGGSMSPTFQIIIMIFFCGLCYAYVIQDFLHKNK